MSADGASDRLENPFARRRADAAPGGGARAAVAGERPSVERELRPMTGYEEELVEERRGDPNTAALCNELIARCLAPPGGDAIANRARVRSMLVAERDAALVRLRRISLGDSVSSRIRCPACGHWNDVDFNLGDLPVAVHEAPERIDVAAPGGVQATLRLPTAGDQEDLLASGLEGESLRRTFLLARTLVRLGDREGPFDIEAARALPLGVRNALEAALERAVPDLDLSMAAQCAGCGHGWSAPFDVPSFFLPR